MTDFEEKVLKEVLTIPAGELRTYKWLAKKAGNRRAYSAVANVLRRNPYPFFIPCHRVVKSDGKLGGYSLGENLKKELINLEKIVKNVLK